MGPEAVKSCSSKYGDDEEVESTVHFVGERSDRQNYEST